MGGIAIDLETKKGDYTHLFGGAKRLTLTAKGVALLARCNRMPEILIDEIKDKKQSR
jgi:hypothetical protein